MSISIKNRRLAGRIEALWFLALLWLPLAHAAPYDPNLGSTIDTYLTGKGSPIAGNGATLFSSGVTHNVDPRLVVAIAGAESSFATKWVNCPASGLNAWSYFYNKTCANSPFASYAAGIERVTSQMARYFNRNLKTISAIGKVYCGTGAGCSPWAPNVTSFYTAQGADVTDLTFASLLIDFEKNQGSSLFGTASPPLTIGIATFSGGETLTSTTNLPADRSTTYGTAYICTGCSSAITISFSQSVSNFSFWILNGQTVTVTYTVQDDTGGQTTETLASNANSGYATIMLPAKGVRKVTITGNYPQWDFLIDNVRFAPSGPSP